MFPDPRFPASSISGKAVFKLLILKRNKGPGEEELNLGSSPSNPAGETIRFKGHIAELDGLRGVAILLVLFHHLWPFIWSHPALTIISRASHVSWIGVDLFFVLSGFLITGILLDSREKPGYFKNFFARRTLRIFPLYYFFLLLTLILLPWLMQAVGHPLPEVENQPWFWLYGANYLWLTGAFKPPEYLGITWSLAVEEQFYLVWPWIVLLLFSRLRLVLVLLIAAAVVIRVWFVLNIDAWADATYMASISRADTLLVGAAIAWYVRSGYFNPEHWKRAVTIALFVCLPLVIMIQLAWPGRSNPLFSALGYTLLAVGLAGLLAHVIQLKTSPVKRLMRNPVLIWFGKYSYGIYLYHMLIWYLTHLYINAELKADGTPLHPAEFSPLAGSMLLDAVVRLAFCLGLTCIIAWLSFRYFERYFLKLKKYF